MMKAPSCLLDDLELMKNVINVPKLGSSSSLGGSGLQLNISHPLEVDHGAAIVCRKGYSLIFLGRGIIIMGKSGLKHYDDRDALGSYASVTSHPDIPEDYEPGVLQLLLFRICVRLQKFTTINFSGFFLHAGTAPTPPEGTTLKQWETRLNIVKYSQGIAASGLCRYPIAASPNNVDVWYSSPETRVPEWVSSLSLFFHD